MIEVAPVLIFLRAGIFMIHAVAVEAYRAP